MNRSASCIHQDVKAGCAVAQVQQKALEAQVGLRRRNQACRRQVYYL
jgi:hypothetical protein